MSGEAGHDDAPRAAEREVARIGLPPPGPLAPAQAGSPRTPKPMHRERPLYHSTRGAAERWRPRAFPKQWLALLAGACVLAVGLQIALETQRLGQVSGSLRSEPAFSDPRIVWVDPVAPSAPAGALAESRALTASAVPRGAAAPVEAPAVGRKAEAPLATGRSDSAQSYALAGTRAETDGTAEVPAEALRQDPPLADITGNAAGANVAPGDAAEPAGIDRLVGAEGGTADIGSVDAAPTPAADPPAALPATAGKEGWFGPFRTCAGRAVPGEASAPRELRAGSRQGQFLLVPTADADTVTPATAGPLCLEDASGVLGHLFGGEARIPQSWDWRVEADGRIAIRPWQPSAR